jgi:hypothetical protein
MKLALIHRVRAKAKAKAITLTRAKVADHLSLNQGGKDSQPVEVDLKVLAITRNMERTMLTWVLRMASPLADLVRQEKVISA